MNYIQCMDMNVMEFFAIAYYAYYKAEKQQAELNKFNNIKKY